jgi:hypothetical protein
MNTTTTTNAAYTLDEIALRDLLDSEVVLIGGGELIAEFH